MKELEELTKNDEYSITGIERALDLPVGFLKNPKNLELPETKALIKMIHAMPWLILVADANYAPAVAEAAIKHVASQYAVWGDPKKENIIL